MTITNETLQERFTHALPALSAAERKVGEYLVRNPDLAIDSTAVQIAAATGTSDATVIRTVQNLGYQGMREIKRTLLQDALNRRNLVATLGHSAGKTLSTERPVNSMLTESVELLERFRQDLNEELIEKAAALIAGARRTFVYGLGPGNHIAGLVALHLGRVGCDVQHMSQSGYRIADELVFLTAADTVVLFAPFHETAEVQLLAEQAEAVGASLVLITESLGASLGATAQVVIKTPPTVANLASESLVPLTIGYALAMQVVTLQKQAATRRSEEFNRLAAHFTERPSFATESISSTL